MKKNRILAILLVLVLCASMLSACGDKEVKPNATPTGTVTPGDNNNTEPGNNEDGESHNYGTWDEISCKDIAKEIGAGWNVGNQLEASSGGKPFETAWQSTPITPQLIKLVKESGFNFVRVPVSYLGKIGEGPDYTLDERWLNRIQQVVDYCYAEDMYVMINMHGDGYGSVKGGWLLPYEKDQEEILKKYEAVWRQIAERFKDYDEHLIFESMNEVGSEKDCNAEIYNNLNAYNQLFLNTVRQAGGNNDKRYVLVPGYNTNIEKTTDGSGFKIPEDLYLSKDVAEGEKRVMVSVHYYSPWSFCGGETDDATEFGVNADPSKGANWGEEPYMEQEFKTLYDCFTSKGYPVIIGEYGAIDKSHADELSNEFRAYFCYMVCKLSIKYDLIPVYWDNGFNGKYGFGLFDRKNFKVTQQGIIDAIMAAFAEGESKESSSLKVAEANVALEAGGASGKITVSDNSGDVSYSSSDYSVATVDKNGTIYPQLAGNCEIIVKDSTGIVKVPVTVSECKVTNIKLYLLETKGWQTCASLEAVSLDKPGKYTLSLKASDTAISRIGALYLKDSALQEGIISKSIIKKAKVVVNSVTVNGLEMTLNDCANNANMLNGKGELDFTILNMWADSSVQIVAEGEKSNDGYSIKGVDPKGDNEIVVTFTIIEAGY